MKKTKEEKLKNINKQIEFLKQFKDIKIIAKDDKGKEQKLSLDDYKEKVKKQGEEKEKVKNGNN